MVAGRITPGLRRRQRLSFASLHGTFAGQERGERRSAAPFQTGDCGCASQAPPSRHSVSAAGRAPRIWPRRRLGVQQGPPPVVEVEAWWRSWWAWPARSGPRQVGLRGARRAPSARRCRTRRRRGRSRARARRVRDDVMRPSCGGGGPSIRRGSNKTLHPCHCRVAPSGYGVSSFRRAAMVTSVRRGRDLLLARCRMHRPNSTRCGRTVLGACGIVARGGRRLTHACAPRHRQAPLQAGSVTEASTAQTGARSPPDDRRHRPTRVDRHARAASAK